MLSAPILLAQVFSFCPSLAFYDQPKGNIVQINGSHNVSMSDVRNEYNRDPSRLRDLGWTEIVLVDGRGNLVNKETYWVKDSEMCGKFKGR